MLAKLSEDDIPVGEGWLYEPKWDGFRAHRLPRRRASCNLSSRKQQPLESLLPGAAGGCCGQAPAQCAVSSTERLSIAGGEKSLDSMPCSQRIHPAASRVNIAGRGDTLPQLVAFERARSGGTKTCARAPLDRALRRSFSRGGERQRAGVGHPRKTGRALPPRASAGSNDYEGAGLDGADCEAPRPAP